MIDPRLIAAETLQNVITNKVFFSEAKNANDIREHKDFAFINMLVLTTLRHFTYLEKLLKKFVQKPLPEKAAFAHFALLTAAAELLYLQTPDYAVLNSYVNLIKTKQDKYLGNFANAVLRNLCRQKDSLPVTDHNEFFPESFIKLLRNDYSKDQISTIESFAAIEPPLDLTAKDHPLEWSQKLEGTMLASGSIRLANSGKIAQLAGFAEGSWWVQDAAAALAVKLLGNLQDCQVLDLCAAPGGKTAQLLNAGAQVTALDISEDRLQTLTENLQRLKFALPQIVCADALDYLQHSDCSQFSAILLDAPCSATGTLRRHPELVHLKSAKDVNKSIKLQKQILDAAAASLRPGGTLVYAVCSLLPAEGEKQIATFLESHPNFQLLPVQPEELNAFPGEPLNECINSQGCIRTLPFHLGASGGMDSFFIARLHKEG